MSPDDGYTTLAWLPDNRHLLALYYKQHTDRAQIGVITIPSGEFHSVTNDVNSYSQLALSGDGRTLATVLTNIDSNIAFYGPDGGVPVSTIPLRISPNTHRLAHGGPSALYRWRLQYRNDRSSDRQRAELRRGRHRSSETLSPPAPTATSCSPAIPRAAASRVSSA